MINWPAWLIVLTVIACVVLVLGGPVVLILKGYRAYNSAAERRVGALYSRLEAINGPISKNFVDMYVYYGLIAWANESSMRVYLTPSNVDEVESLARRLRSFTLRWGVLAKGAIFVPITTWWNYRSVFKTTHLYRKSV